MFSLQTFLMAMGKGGLFGFPSVWSCMLFDWFRFGLFSRAIWFKFGYSYSGFQMVTPKKTQHIIVPELGGG